MKTSELHPITARPVEPSRLSWYIAGSAMSICMMTRQMGGKGGKKRIERLTPEERTALAKKAAAKSAEVRSKKAAENKVLTK